MRKIIRCWAAIKAARVISMRTILRTVAGCLCALSIAGAVPASAATPMSYFDGPVVGQIEIVPVFWSSHVNSTITSNIPQFFQDAVNSSWYSALAEYSTAGFSGGTNQYIARGTGVAGVTLTPVSCSGTGNCNLSDAAIQTELNRQIGLGNLPANSGNVVYVLFVPPNVTVVGPDGIGDGGVNWCTYHNTAGTTGTPLIYAVNIDMFTGGGATGCGSNSTALETHAKCGHRPR
jgi:hypothetical protein